LELFDQIHAVVYADLKDVFIHLEYDLSLFLDNYRKVQVWRPQQQLCALHTLNVCQLAFMEIHWHKGLSLYHFC